MSAVQSKRPLELPESLLRGVPAAQLTGEAPAGDSPRRRASAPMLLGGMLLLFVLLAALAGPALVRYAPEMIKAGPRLAPPGPQYWFGTDAFGRDMFSRVIHGFRASLWISLAATAITVVPGVLLGLLAGYCRGWVDQLLSRLVEVLLSLPGLLLAIVLIARLGPSLQTMIIALGITGIPTFFRITRSETLGMSRQAFIEAGISIGLPGRMILFRHIFPNILGSILVLTSIRMGTFLLMGSGLSFIGLGVQPPDAELGALLAAGKEYYQTAWWLAAFPGLAILLAVLGFNLAGEGMRDRLV